MKERPNHRRYIEVLRSMTPEQRLRKAFELSEFSKTLFVQGLRCRHPALGPEAFAELVRARLGQTSQQELLSARVTAGIEQSPHGVARCRRRLMA